MSKTSDEIFKIKTYPVELAITKAIRLDKAIAEIKVSRNLIEKLIEELNFCLQLLEGKTK